MRRSSDQAASPREVRLARHAMRSRFEILLEGADAARLRAAGEEALAEVGLLERQLSLFDPASEISGINGSAAGRPCRIEPQLFQLLVRCRQLWRQTSGRFDPTVGSQSASSMGLVRLDPKARTVFFRRPGTRLDLGGIGKGYALDRAAALLREAGVGRALLHAGTSSVLAIGRWEVAVAAPEAGRILARLQLHDTALGVSSNRQRPHVLDPAGGKAADGMQLAVVCAAEATDADALSTALLCGADPTGWLCQTSGVLWLSAAGAVRTRCPGERPPLFQIHPDHSTAFEGGSVRSAGEQPCP